MLRVCAFVSPYLPGLDGRPLIEDCLVAGGKVFRRRERQDHCDEALVRDGIRAMLLPLDAVRHWEVRVGDAIWSPSDGPLMAFVTARGGEIALSERDGGDYLPEVILHDALRQCVFTAFYERDLRIKFTDLLA